MIDLKKKVSTKDRLLYIMEHNSLKQVDIVNKCQPFCLEYGIKMNKSDMSQYVSGKVEPSQDKLIILGMALNVSPAWLMGFDVPMEWDKTPCNSDYLTQIKAIHGQTAAIMIEKCLRLDNDDQNKIIGRVEVMLEADKYNQDESSSGTAT